MLNLIQHLRRWAGGSPLSLEDFIVELLILTYRSENKWLENLELVYSCQWGTT